MAIARLNEVRSVSCRFITGIDDKGKEKYMSRTIANFKTDADLEDINETVLAVASLYPYNIKIVTLTERSELEEA
ncbi:MAG: DUF1659 domain-containing protein [Natronincolaceae bacterium]|jgi:hypothetical protein|nr:DUF1659 domain-containing protein [Bacillota bacterium]NLK90577.1 DUF1659 domain-containing protein [Clostridiales bacterium]